MVQIPALKKIDTNLGKNRDEKRIHHSEILSTHCMIGGHGGMFHEDVFSANNHHLIYAASHQRFQRDMGAFV